MKTISSTRAIIGALLFSALVVPAFQNPALADESVNCDAYGQAAVRQQKENLARGCGFKGRGWSTNYAGHVGWCKSANVKMADLTHEDRRRAQALQACDQKSTDALNKLHERSKSCLKYANKAKELRDKINAVCKGGGEWPKTKKQDVDHCLQVGGASADRENLLRTRKIEDCTRANETIRFSSPRGPPFNNLVDVCIDPRGLFCGKTAADDYCKYKGFKELVSWKQGSTNLTTHLNCMKSGESKRECHCNGKCGYLKEVVCRGRK